MPYADPEKNKAYWKARYWANREEDLARSKEYRDKNKERLSTQAKEYYLANREQLIARATERAKANAEQISEYQARYREANKEKLDARGKKYRKTNRETMREKQKSYRAENPNRRLRESLSNRLYKVLLGKSKSAKTLELLGCTIEFLRVHLEKQFVPGMTWKNYGPVWHVDHILPCAEFHLQHSEEQEICFHWTNLQSLFAADNLSKSDKII